MGMASADTDDSRIDKLAKLVQEAGSRLAGGWRSQITQHKWGRDGVFISPEGKQFKGYKDVLRHLELSDEPHMVAPVASRADNLQKLKHTANDAQARPTLPESAFMIRQLAAEKAAQFTNELTPIESIMEEDMPEYIHKICITCNGKPGIYDAVSHQIQCSCQSCIGKPASVRLMTRTGDNGFQKHAGLPKNGDWKCLFHMNITGFEGMSVLDFLQLHGYSIGSGHGKSSQSQHPVSALPCLKTASHASTSGHSQNTQHTQTTSSGAAHVLRPRKRHCTRLHERKESATSPDSTDGLAVSASKPDVIADDLVEQRHGQQQLFVVTKQVAPPPGLNTPQQASTSADGMRLRQQSIQLKSLQSAVDKQAEKLTEYEDLLHDCQQQVTEKDQLLQAKDEQLKEKDQRIQAKSEQCVGLNARFQQQAQLLADTQHLLASTAEASAVQARHSQGEESEWVNREALLRADFDTAMTAVRKKATEAQSDTADKLRTERLRNFELTLLLASK